MTNTSTPRRWWPWVVLAIVLLAAIVAGLAMHFAKGNAPKVTKEHHPSPVASAAVGDSAPTGCLGGSKRDAAMVLSAERLAPHTTNGAVEVATAFVRWLNQYPYPTASSYRPIEESGLSTTAPTRDLGKFFATKPNLSGGLVPDGTTYHLSTAPGVFHVESEGTGESRVSIGTALVVGGVMSPTLKGSITVTVHWEAGSWRFVKSEGTRTTENLYSIGTPFTAGC
jgi:hypothetical protein